MLNTHGFPVTASSEELWAVHSLCTELDKHGHRLGPWQHPPEEVAGSVELIFNSFERRCACGVGLIAGWDGRGHFHLMPGCNGDYGRGGEELGYEYQLQAPEVRERIESPCPLEERQEA